MRTLLALVLGLTGTQAVSATTLGDVIAERCLGVLMKGEAWNTDGFREADPSEVGEYQAMMAQMLWISPDGTALLATDGSEPDAQLRFCAAASLPFPASDPNVLPPFGGEEFRALLERLGLEPVEECWGLEAFGSTSWWAEGQVADGASDFAATLSRDTVTIELVAYQPVGDVRRDCVPMAPGGGG
ncbi:MAG: hypothetical protein OEM24_10130 [Paracoccaceae bacterium]|nr:hypothetical protein [Paracoccaceae bacterium]